MCASGRGPPATCPTQRAAPGRCGRAGTSSGARLAALAHPHRRRLDRLVLLQAPHRQARGTCHHQPPGHRLTRLLLPPLGIHPGRLEQRVIALDAPLLRVPARDRCREPRRGVGEQEPFGQNRPVRTEHPTDDQPQPNGHPVCAPAYHRSPDAGPVGPAPPALLPPTACPRPRRPEPSHPRNRHRSPSPTPTPVPAPGPIAAPRDHRTGRAGPGRRVPRTCARPRPSAGSRSPRRSRGRSLEPSGTPGSTAATRPSRPRARRSDRVVRVPRPSACTTTSWTVRRCNSVGHNGCPCAVSMTSEVLNSYPAQSLGPEQTSQLFVRM